MQTFVGFNNMILYFLQIFLRQLLLVFYSEGNEDQILLSFLAYRIRVQV
jgi:hypothetical protein